ncbi:decaprenyl-phosphate phosphoribosyltransferase [Subtercola sp. RTI3]|uniref:decaprenyl-phosphate phosphoribosyltransferase n=1 Tax=Subtercola sp. RTI3 TaxID=3048639 RepID=UPI002B2331BE|nr:decaprenyl-phosphate phosphoribosyltransferase [Subtercola sp. RTI3]MEA9984429.1 decaprenyl-phosphate phosphoribosyltransferase [Subtercola sp. RTI3]
MKAPAIVRALRPHQWLKNVLVVAAPLAAGSLLQSGVWLTVILTFVIFCAASSGVYLINDLLDVEADRAHPKKKYRPIAAGELSVPVALAAGIALLIAAPLVSALIVSVPLALVIALYEVLQIAYCLWFKHTEVVDLVIVSSGFLIRAIAGAVALGIPVSQWFLLVSFAGSLLMVSGKRYSEKVELEHSGLPTRKSLENYSASYLQFVWMLAAGLATISYSLWAFDLGDLATNIWPAVSIVPFSMAILRYAYNVDKGIAGAPEDIVLKDRQLLLFALLWLITFTLSVIFRAPHI